VIFEDLHWIDPTSREFLDLVLARIECRPVLLAATFRPEFQPPWVDQAHATVISLNRLGRSDGAVMVERLAGNSRLPPDVIAEIIERTDGVPLFVEEMTRAVLEAGVERGVEVTASVPPPGLGVTATLQASLMARLDRLGPTAKVVAQIGSAIGREFSYELAASVGGHTEEMLQNALQRLVDAGLVFQRGMPPEAVYLFKHALVQDTADSTLLRGPRRQLHARIAEALVAHYRELMDSQPERFAQHYADAGLIEKSAAYCGKVGHGSAARSAMAEAAAQFRKGLDQLALLADEPDRQRQELEYWSALGAVLILVKGCAAPETGHAYARARELWEQLGFPVQFHQVPYGQSRYHLNRGELDLAQRSAEDLINLSRHRKDPSGLVLAQIVLIQCAARTGQRCPSFPPLRLREPGAGPELGHLLSQHRSCLCGCLHTHAANNCIRAGQQHTHERVFLHPWVCHWHLRVRNALRCRQVYYATRSCSRLQSDPSPAKARIQRLSVKRF
jgi:predicted ATPase